MKLIVYSLVSITAIVSGCTSSGTDCDPVPQTAGIVGLASAAHFRLDGTTEFNSTFVNVEPSDSQTPISEYLMVISTEYLVNSSSGCVGTGFIINSMIENIELTSNSDLTLATPAGISLGDVAKWVFAGIPFEPGQTSLEIRNSVLDSSSLQTLDEYLENLPNQQGSTPTNMYIVFDAPLENSQEHIFTFTLKLSNSETFTIDSAPIILSP